MQFNSYIFILLFLPMAVTGYYLLNSIPKHGMDIANLFLLGMSLWFYAWFNPAYLALIGSSIVVNYALSKLMGGGNGSELRSKSRKWVLAVALAFNLGLIFYYKYSNFFAKSMNHLFATDIPLRTILLPLGISFFTFQQVSYVIDAYYGQTREYRFTEYALFVSFFPQLVAGPIVLHDELIPQLRNTVKRRLDLKNVAAGIHLFTLGLFKKMMIADVVVRGLNVVLLDPEAASATDLWIASLCYTFEIYFDFSGYSDMATGIARMFNLELPMNFDSPYKAVSINDFWKRWHMTLTRFFRKYLYIPLGGSRNGRLRTYINVMIVFTLSGLWHGANYSFVLWGILHGLFCVAERLLKWEKSPVPVVLRRCAAFLVVDLLWLLFRVEDIFLWGSFLGRMFTWHSGRVNPALSWSLIMIVICFGLCLIPENNIRRPFVPSVRNAVVTGLLLLWCVISLNGIFTFIYFNF